MTTFSPPRADARGFLEGTPVETTHDRVAKKRRAAGAQAHAAAGPGLDDDVLALALALALVGS